MSDETVASCLRGPSSIVTIEAPAGCGKTFQGAEFAREAAKQLSFGRVLVLTHTHAACDAFRARTETQRQKVEIRTIDSFVCEIADAYGPAIGITASAGAWAQSEKDGFAILAEKLTQLLSGFPAIMKSIAMRYPVIICDEHQDANENQHALLRVLHGSAVKMRYFGDPMQCIYRDDRHGDVNAAAQRWQALVDSAEKHAVLASPHRWKGSDRELGTWILDCRRSLQSNGKFSLRGKLPNAVKVIYAENIAQDHFGYRVNNQGEIQELVLQSPRMLVLTRLNDVVRGLRPFFYRRIPVWEGYVRNALHEYLMKVIKDKGDAPKVARDGLTFIQNIATGFSNSKFGNRLIAEVVAGCNKPTRGLPSKIQELARCIVIQPNHQGISALLRMLNEYRKTERGFREINIDHPFEYWDAVNVGESTDPIEALAALSLRRSQIRPSMPERALCNVHKAKGLEVDNVLILPCDAKNFPDNQMARNCLYVAMSRAKSSVTFVVDPTSPSPIIET